MDYKTKTFAFDIKQVEGEDRTLIAVASTETPDRDGDILTTGGWRLENYRKNPVVLFGHKYDELPVARTVDIQAGGGILRFKAKFPTKEEHVFADTVYQLYKGGYIRSFSVGFRPLRWEDRQDDQGHFLGRKYLEQELMEISAVNIPTNPGALVEAVSKGLCLGREFLCTGCAHSYSTKSIIPPHEGVKAPEDTAWDAAGARKRLADKYGMDSESPDWEGYAQAFTYIDRREGEAKYPDRVGAYIGPHHDVVDGKLVVVWKGVVAAMSALVFGARGGAISDEGDRRKAYNHLSKHYKQFDKDAPEFKETIAQNTKEDASLLALCREWIPCIEKELKDFQGAKDPVVNVDRVFQRAYGAVLERTKITDFPTLEAALKALQADLVEKEGRVVSRKNRELLQSVLEAIQRLLVADDDEDKSVKLVSLSQVEALGRAVSDLRGALNKILGSSN